MTESIDRFQDITPEGPFAYKVSRGQPIRQHFNRFSELTPDQASELLSVRDGTKTHCIISLPGEEILAEYAGTGYVDESTNRSWGYTIRRHSSGEPSQLSENPPEVAPTPEEIAPRESVQPVIDTVVSTRDTSPDKMPAHPPAEQLLAHHIKPADLPTELHSEADSRAAHAIKAMHEQEVQEISIQLLKQKNRADESEAEIRKLRDEVDKTKQTLVSAQAVRSALQKENEALKIERAKLNEEIPSLKRQVAAVSENLNTVTASLNAAVAAKAEAEALLPEPIPESVEVSAGPRITESDGETIQWIKNQQEQLEREKFSIAQALEKATLDRAQLESLRSDLQNREEELSAQTKIHEKNITWVPEHSSKGRAAYNDEVARMRTRVFICWIISVMFAGAMRSPHLKDFFPPSWPDD